MRSSRLAVLAIASGVTLALGLAAFAWTLGAGSSGAEQGAMQNCPQPGKWAISVWSGDDGTATEQAFATCGANAVAAAYSIDADTQVWSRYIAGRAEVTNLTTLDKMQGVMAFGAGGAPKTPTLGPGWTKIEPAGDTICAEGTPFAYWVHPGTVNRLVVYFEGGGACWNAATCSNPDVFYDHTVDETDNPANHPQGIGDLDNPDNPFKDWFMVFIPYCTGDIHWGNNTQTYTAADGQSIVINHKGFVNFTAVLDWIEAQFEKPEKIFVSGFSAGSYGSIMGAAHIHKGYPDVPLYQLGDSGAGVITPDFFASGFPNWGAAQNIPDWIPGLQPWTEITMAKLYTAVADFYSSDRWSQYNTAHDENQTFYYSAMRGTGDWGQLMLASIHQIQDSAPNFHAYIAPGEIHCITPFDSFYDREVNGIKLTDWLRAMVNDQTWGPVTCTDCETDPLAP